MLLNLSIIPLSNSHNFSYSHRLYSKIMSDLLTYNYLEFMYSLNIQQCLFTLWPKTLRNNIVGLFLKHVILTFSYYKP